MSLLRPPVAPVLRQLSRRLGALVLLSLVMLAPGLSASGCSEEPGAKCVGGVDVGGHCQPKCDPAKCLDGNVCVNNQCKLVCLRHTDCNWPAQACQPTTDTDAVTGDVLLSWLAGASGVCTDLGRLPHPGTIGAPCPNKNECTATACPNGFDCDFVSACDNGDGTGPHPELCARDDGACGANDPCNMGWCSNMDAPCVFNTCDVSQCLPALVCHSEGEGDMNAYCTRNDCQADGDCPAGFTCGVTRDPHPICGTQKGNNTLCGTTDEPCIDPANFNANGATYFEGSLCLLRKTCLKRQSCMACQNNLDCSLDSQQVCIPFAGETVCARFCATDPDCYADEICGPSYDTCEIDKNLPCPSPPGCPPRPCLNGTCASGPDGLPGPACTVDADCPQQTCVQRKVCVPAEGACRTAGGGFCHHCVNDTDCGDASGSQGCEQIARGQFACFDESFPDQCPTDSDSECPQAPSGAHGECLDDNEGVSQGDPVWHHCYFPFDNAKMNYTCWP
jgi:hypothetical protein